ncbi:DUF6383 domain-containing protein [Parabacteroides merdae]|uniref:DUF6383 domain-containing protein n=1 Tax=Parabacteroides merdae TaxID=46503 RepID=UPI00321A9DCB
MNKRFSTLLAAALVAGSFSSAFAQLEGRNVEWKDAQASRAYYLAGVHFVSPTDYLQAFSLQGLVNGADITAANPVAAAQWTVETKKVGTVTHYAFKNIEGEQYLAFEKKDGAYALAAKKEANDETKSFRWFTVAANGNLQAVLSDEKEPYFLGLKNDGTADWSLALLQSSEHHTDGSTSVIKKKVALYEIYNDQITAEAFASKFGENFTIEFLETLDDMDVFENVSVEKIANDNLGFKLVDNKGTKDTKDDEYVVLANERVSNSELAANAIGYRYAKMTAKAIKDKKIDDKNTVFYAEENETNIGDGKYALVQKVKVGDLDNKDVTFGKVTNDETTRQLASVEYDCHSTFMGVTVGKGTRVANTEVANERMLIVNVTAKVADKKNSSALGLKNDFTGARWYDKVSEADFDQPQGQWLVAAGSATNTIKLINVQKPGFVQDNIRLYEAEGENTYTVFASDLGLSGLETITLTKVEDYDKLNGYYSTLSDINQKFAFVTTGEYANEEAGSDLYLKAGVEGNVVTVVPHAGSEWELIRNEKAQAVTANYKYYDGEKWVELNGKGNEEKGILPADTVRLAYSYAINADELGLGTAWKMAKDDIEFFLKENGKGTYAIVYGATADEVKEYGVINGSEELVAETTDFTNSTPFEIIDLDAAPSLAADSKHMTFEATNSIGFIASDENNNAVLAKETAALWVDSVNAEGYATPKFFISYAGKMMTTAKKFEEIVDKAYANDEISKKEYAELTADENLYYKSVERIKFVDAERLSGEDTLVIADEKYTGKDIEDFKFKVTENEDGDYVLKANGNYVYVINGNLVYGTDAKEAEAFVIEVTSAPTANEGIATSEVKVIAGEGNVTIAGAAGKKVVISNILGQVVANTVVSSDNATIAAPAGVVVVAVEGEAAVKAIVK